MSVIEVCLSIGIVAGCVWFIIYVIRSIGRML